MTETQRIQHDSKERVAYDLMRAISGAEPASDDKSTRDYWITLYNQCYRACSGASARNILESA